MDIVELPRDKRLKVFSEVMSAAREMGFSGFGGACWSAAVAINRLLFSSRGRYTMGVNAALHAAQCTVGHVAVTIADEVYDSIHLDADGRPKSGDEIESWGMLDPDDYDWGCRAEGFGVQWSEEAATGAELLAVTEEELLVYAEQGLLERQLRILERAIARVQPSAPASSSLSMG